MPPGDQQQVSAWYAGTDGHLAKGRAEVEGVASRELCALAEFFEPKLGSLT